jgi:type VI secretion system secreted protein VgrG
MSFTQDDKLISIDTPLGKDALLLTGFNGEEGISRLFNFELSMISERHAISFDAIIGKGVTVSIGLANGNRRYINGIISSFSQSRGGGEGGADAWFSYYRATLVPWVWVLTKKSDCRIFQNLSIAEIVERVFEDQGFSDYRMDLQLSYDKREYCVQYRETDFNFVSRLLEEEGIFYYFEHENGKHTIVFADSPVAHRYCPAQRAVSYELSAQGVRGDDAITSLETTQQICSAKFTLKDFNFKLPNNDLKVEVQSGSKLNLGDREIYQYPGNFDSKSSGDRLARIRAEEEESRLTRISGMSDCRDFVSGYRFTLKDHYHSEVNNKDYVLVSVHHEATEGYGADTGQSYHNSFECLPHSVPYRPPCIAARPLVLGSQTAVVVGPAGEEIHTDAFGRVKVQFHWDREGKRDDKSSCWMRVSQAWAGNGWGGMHIPRVGHEVIVNFIEGDPDRPIVTGQLYHGINMPPYALPEQKTRSTFKSNSSKGGSGFNEIRFEDKKDAEQVFIHAEKNLDVRVKNDAMEWVGNDRHLIVTKDQQDKVDGDKHLTVTGDQNEKVDGTVSLTAGLDLQQKVGAKHALDAGQEIHLKAGMKVIIEAGLQISLRVGGSFVDIGPAGVTINGTPINSGGSPAVGFGASPALPKVPKEADKAQPGMESAPLPAKANLGPQAATLKRATHDGMPFCET